MAFSALFPIRELCLYLDHAHRAPLPLPSTQAMERVQALEREGFFWQDRELEHLGHRVRSLLAQVLGCQGADVSLYPDRSTALLALFLGLSFPPRSRALLASHDPAQVASWERLLRRLGFSVQSLAPFRWAEAEGLLARLEPPFHLVLVPWVDEHGWVGELELLRPLLHESQATRVLDGSQAVPVCPDSFPALGVDALLVPAHTWLLGPLGVTALVTREALRQGWLNPLPEARHPLSHQHPDASCFDAPGLPPAVLAGFAQSLELLLREGLTEVRRRIQAHQRGLTRMLLELGWHLGSPGATHPVAGIVVAKHPFFPAEEVQRRLASFQIRVGAVEGWVRFSPHFYATFAEMEALHTILKRL